MSTPESDFLHRPDRRGALCAGTRPRLSPEMADAALVSLLIADLADWTGASWVVALTVSKGRLDPIGAVGRYPSMQACIDRTAAFLREHGNPPPIRPFPAPADSLSAAMPSLVARIPVQGDLRAVLAFGPKADSTTYSRGDRQLIAEATAHLSTLLGCERLAGLVAANLSAMNRVQADLESARAVQGRLFPSRLPDIAGLDYHGECRPAGEVGGDFYDFVESSTHGLVASVGDVSGHGIGSAIVMSGLQSFLRNLSASDARMAEAVAVLNRTLCELSPDNFYSTLFYARVEPARKRLRYVSAGHEPPLLLRRHGSEVFRLESTATVIGLTDRTEFRERTVALQPGDILVAFTDGITEALDGDGRAWCDDGVLDVIRAYPEASAFDLVWRILDAVDCFTGHARPSDDRTVIVIRVDEAAERVPSPVRRHSAYAVA